VPVEVFAQRFNMSSGEGVSNLLVTAKRTFARMLRETVREYLRDEQEIEAEIADLRRVLARGRA
jgi:hypothetical protein